MFSTGFASNYYSNVQSSEKEYIDDSLNNRCSGDTGDAALSLMQSPRLLWRKH